MTKVSPCQIHVIVIIVANSRENNQAAEEAIHSDEPETILGTKTASKYDISKETAVMHLSLRGFIGR